MYESDMLVLPTNHASPLTLWIVEYMAIKLKNKIDCGPTTTVYPFPINRETIQIFCVPFFPVLFLAKQLPPLWVLLVDL